MCGVHGVSNLGGQQALRQSTGGGGLSLPLDVGNAASISSQSLIMLSRSEHASLISFSGRVSLAATAHKLIWTIVQHKIGTQREVQQHLLPRNAAKEVFHGEHMRTVDNLDPGFLLTKMLKAMCGLDKLLREVQHGTSSSNAKDGGNIVNANACINSCSSSSVYGSNTFCISGCSKDRCDGNCGAFCIGGKLSSRESHRKSANESLQHKIPDISTVDQASLDGIPSVWNKT